MEHVVGFAGFLECGSYADHAAFTGTETHKPFLLPSFKGLEVQLQLFPVMACGLPYVAGCRPQRGVPSSLNIPACR